MSEINTKSSVPHEILDPDLLDFKLSNISDLIPFLSRVRGKNIVIKCGGSYLAEDAVMSSMCKDIAILSCFGANIVMVHGGGPEVGEALESLGAKNEILDSHRVADEKVVDIAQMVLSGKIGPRLVDYLARAGACGASISAKDGNMIVASKLRRVKRDRGSNVERILNLGMVGEPRHLNGSVISAMLDSKIIPIISPIGLSSSGEKCILNPDSVAAFVAHSIKADRLILLSGSNGVTDPEGTLLTALSADILKAMIADGAVGERLAFKCECAILAIKNGVRAVHICNGAKRRAVLLNLFDSHSEGTMIYEAKGIGC